MGISQAIAEKTLWFGESIGVLAIKPFSRFFDNPVEGPDPVSEETLTWLRRPLKRQSVFSIQKGRYIVKVFDQPGRWMRDDELHRLYGELKEVAADSMEQLPRYGIFTGKREAFANRIAAVAYDHLSSRPVAFTVMVYLPFQQERKTRPIIHLGLTMIRRSYRGHRLQTPLFQKIFLLAMLNQRCLSFTMTNIAASPAGIGATSDYFINVFPNYKKTEKKAKFHLDVAEQVLAKYRTEFGCSRFARFDPETFVVRGSNQARGGGATEFIKDDPVSRYRVDACNEFCREHLDFQAGDELFQVGKVDYVRSSWASRRSRRMMKQLNNRRECTAPHRLQRDIR